MPVSSGEQEASDALLRFQGSTTLKLQVNCLGDHYLRVILIESLSCFSRFLLCPANP